VRPTALTVSPDGRYVATGSESGVVNVYGRNPATGELVSSEGGVGPGGAQRPPAAAPLALASMPPMGAAVNTRVKPSKEVMNLTTQVDSLAFSHDSQVMPVSQGLLVRTLTGVLRQQQ
jgi:U3 small nucleolar RNA-associated protein 18